MNKIIHDTIERLKEELLKKDYNLFQPIIENNRLDLFVLEAIKDVFKQIRRDCAENTLLFNETIPRVYYRGLNWFIPEYTVHVHAVVMNEDNDVSISTSVFKNISTSHSTFIGCSDILNDNYFINCSTLKTYSPIPIN